jgi:hypothetical protein
LTIVHLGVLFCRSAVFLLVQFNETAEPALDSRSRCFRPPAKPTSPEVKSMRSSSRRNIFQKVTALLTMLAFNASVGNALAGSSLNEATSLHRSVPVRAKRNPIENSAIPDPRSGSVVERTPGRPIELQRQNHSLGVHQTWADNHRQMFGAKNSDTSNHDTSTHAQTLSYSKLPMSFESNDGQADAAVKFLAHGRGHTVLITDSGPEFILRRPESPEASPALTPQRSEEKTISNASVAMRFPG